MTRKEANIQILAKITEYVTLYPDTRFGQALRNLGVIVDFQDPPGHGEPKWSNHFNEESDSILKRMDEREKEK